MILQDIIVATLENMVGLIMPLYLAYLLLLDVIDYIINTQRDTIIHIKRALVIPIVFFVFISVLTITMLSIHELAVAFEGQEVSFFVKEIAYTAIIFVWQMIGVLIINKLWYLPKKEIIPRKIKVIWRNKYGKRKSIDNRN